MGVPGVVVIHDYDEETGRFRGLLLKVDEDSLIYINEKDVSGAGLIPRNRVIELLSKEATLSVLLERHPELVDEALSLLAEETSFFRQRAVR